MTADILVRMPDGSLWPSNGHWCVRPDRAKRIRVAPDAEEKTFSAMLKSLDRARTKVELTYDVFTQLGIIHPFRVGCCGHREVILNASYVVQLTRKGDTLWASHRKGDTDPFGTGGLSSVVRVVDFDGELAAVIMPIRGVTRPVLVLAHPRKHP